MPPEPPKKHIPEPPKHHSGLNLSKRTALAIGLVLAFIVAGITGYVMFGLGISIETILPVLAPVWVGVLTLSYTILRS